MKNRALKFKNDRFKRVRGSYSRWLLIFCEKCKKPLLTYQKDGPGILKRLYIDRIVNPEFYGKDLVCKKCKTLIGIRVIYQKEKRPAYRLFAGAIGKQIINADRMLWAIGR
ncbi:MAG: hypothetical protein HZB99_02475 [Candidatus Harrisonbacteria bacterium]|nr:hypothetical protein [Candidatus Harrisonbacteria bacterium]